jgi:Zn-dependent peptidase ImmA (M78 family)
VSYREDVLRAVYEADRLHKTFGTETAALAGEGRVDVFQMLVERDVPVLFRPLKSLLGAYINDPDKGIMVTSERPLPIQRFTAAHELGHEVLGHQASLDDEEVLARALFTNQTYDRREVQANAFASQLLTPPWLIAHHMRRQGFTREDLADPGVVYQLSLRIGSSFTAICYVLEANRSIDANTRQSLMKQRKTLKQRLLRPYKPNTSYGDVWVVTDKDNGAVLEGSRSDLVVLRVQENLNAGYVWQFGDLVDAGLTVRRDDRTASASEAHIGGVVFRTVVAECASRVGARGHIRAQEVRPWSGAGNPLTALEFDVEFSGPVAPGLLPAQRAAVLAAA